MRYFLLFVKLLPYLVTLCGQIEDWCNADDADESKGADKKAAVLSAGETIFTAIEGTTTGGANETWQKIKPLASKTIDTLCAFMF